MAKRQDGRYVKKVTLPDGTKKYVYGKNQPEVNEKARQLRNEYDSGIIVNDKTTVGEWAAQWFLVYKSSLRTNTQAMYVNAYEKHIAPYIKDVKLKDVRALHVQKIMNNVATKSESLQKKVLITLKQQFETAQFNKLIPSNPTKGIKITPINSPEKIKFLTEEQQKKLLESVEEPRALAFCALCLYAGLRREEALGVMWTDINKNELTVRRAITFDGNNPDTDQKLKSKSAARTVPVPTQLKAILDKTPKRALYIITNARGGEVTKSAFRKMWTHVTNVVDFEVRPHMLRHTYATMLYKAGIDLKTAQYLMGHANISVTANIYTHVEKSTASSSIDKLQKFLSGCQTSCQTDKKDDEVLQIG